MATTQKFLDAEGVKYLWSKVSLEDYPNNETLIAVLNAIDQTKADSSHTHDDRYYTETEVDEEILVINTSIDNKYRAINRKINSISKPITEQDIDTAFNDIFGGN